MRTSVIFIYLRLFYSYFLEKKNEEKDSKEKKLEILDNINQKKSPQTSKGLVTIKPIASSTGEELTKISNEKPHRPRGTSVSNKSVSKNSSENDLKKTHHSDLKKSDTSLPQSKRNVPSESESKEIKNTQSVPSINSILQHSNQNVEPSKFFF